MHICIAIIFRSLSLTMFLSLWAALGLQPMHICIAVIFYLF